MASLQERNGSNRVIFRPHGQQHFLTNGKVSPQEAEAKASQADFVLMRLEQGLIELPPGIGIAEFIEHDGKSNGRLRRAVPPPGPPVVAASRVEVSDQDVLQSRVIFTNCDRGGFTAEGGPGGTMDEGR